MDGFEFHVTSANLQLVNDSQSTTHIIAPVTILKVKRHGQFIRSEKMQSDSKVKWYSLMLISYKRRKSWWNVCTPITKDQISFYCPENLLVVWLLLVILIRIGGSNSFKTVSSATYVLFFVLSRPWLSNMSKPQSRDPCALPTILLVVGHLDRRPETTPLFKKRNVEEIG